jgi:hypothetical protein
MAFRVIHGIEWRAALQDFSDIRGCEACEKQGVEDGVFLFILGCYFLVRLECL